MGGGNPFYPGFFLVLTFFVIPAKKKEVQEEYSARWGEGRKEKTTYL
jgi:hypothetical protein